MSYGAGPLESPTIMYDEMRRQAPHRVKVAWLDPRALPDLLMGKLRLSCHLPDDVRVLYIWCAPERRYAWGVCLESKDFDPVPALQREIPEIDGSYEILRTNAKGDEEWVTL